MLELFLGLVVGCCIGVILMSALFVSKGVPSES